MVGYSDTVQAVDKAKVAAVAVADTVCTLVAEVVMIAPLHTQVVAKMAANSDPFARVVVVETVAT